MAKIKICLDAGHYGKYNRSPAVKSYYESEMNWKLHNLLKKYLEQYGIEVILTRNDQAKDLELTARGKKAAGCNLFISIHSNAVGNGVNESVDYVAVYHLTDDNTTQIDEQSKQLAGKFAPVIAELMGVKQGWKISTRKSGNDRNNDGMMNDNYYGVLHGARSVGVPGLILEHSFHTNTKSTNWLLDDSNLDKMARAEADVIAAYYGIEKPTSPESSGGGDVLYRVQVGAYSVKKNAEAQLARVKAAGFTDAFITTTGGKVVATEPVKKSNAQIAKEVIDGKWGNGEDRKKRLTEAGYDPAAVQKEVNRILKG